MRPSVRQVLVALWLVSAAAQSGAADFAEEVPLYRELRDWVVACDNQRRCQALSAPADWGYSELHLVISRDAGPKGALRLALNYAGEGAARQLSLDGEDLSAMLDPVDADNGLLLWREDGAARRLIATLRNANRLQLDADEDASVSLAGLSASLLLMDSVQGRIGTRGALHRPGDAADEQVPLPVVPPALRPYPGSAPMDAEERAAIGTAVVAATREQWHDDAFEAPREVLVHPLGQDQALVVMLLDCAAYNCEYALYRVARQAPHAERPLQIEQPPLAHTGLSGWVAYDEATGRLAYAMKSRGIGDCGEAGDWLFDGEQFQLAGYSAMPRCAGVADWPRLWRRD